MGYALQPPQEHLQVPRPHHPPYRHKVSPSLIPHRQRHEKASKGEAEHAEQANQPIHHPPYSRKVLPSRLRRRQRRDEAHNDKTTVPAEEAIQADINATPESGVEDKVAAVTKEKESEMVDIPQINGQTAWTKDEQEEMMMCEADHPVLAEEANKAAAA